MSLITLEGLARPMPQQGTVAAHQAGSRWNSNCKVKPKNALEAAVAMVDVISPQSGSVNAWERIGHAVSGSFQVKNELMVEKSSNQP